jgi:hypothetical protein
VVRGEHAFLRRGEDQIRQFEPALERPALEGAAKAAAQTRSMLTSVSVQACEVRTWSKPTKPSSVPS